jgi:nucleoid-associated protein YgaU
MDFAKATLEVLDEAARDADRGISASIPVQFNPTEYTLTKGAQIAEIAIPRIDSPILQFVAGQNEKLTLDLYFDTTLESSPTGGVKPVTDYTKKVYQLVKIAPKTHAPPRVKFLWGEGLSFTAILESVTQKFTLFNPEGVPLRATLSVTFREYKTLQQQLAELNLQSADHTKRHIVVQGETLASIAAREYGDPGLWRVIADENPNLNNLRRLVPGVELQLPPLEKAGRGIGRGRT